MSIDTACRDMHPGRVQGYTVPLATLTILLTTPRYRLPALLQHHPHLDGLSLFTVPPALHQHDRHSHDCLSVIMLTAGQKSYWIEGQRLAVHSGQIAVANPGDVHGCEFVDDAPWAHRTWYVSATLLRQLCTEVELRDRAEFVLPVIDSAPLHRHLTIAHAAAQVGNELAREAAALHGLMLLISQHGHERVPQHCGRAWPQVKARVARCQDIIQASALHRLDLGMLARETGVGRHQVIRDFQRVLHLTPGDYLGAVRLERAKGLIARGLPLAEVAHMAGFSDQSHFARAFRRVHGFTPSEFAGAARGRSWMRMV